MTAMPVLHTMRLPTIVILLMLLVGCESRPERGWFVLRWIDKPRTEAIKNSEAIPDEALTKFDLVHRYTIGKDDFPSIKSGLKEGDLVAYRCRLHECEVCRTSSVFRSPGCRFFVL